MLKKQALMTALIALLLLVAPVWSKELVPDDFQHTTGDLVDGWYWLRDEGDRVDWTFNDGNTLADLQRRKAIKCSNFTIPFDVLLEEAPTGDMGHDKSNLALRLESNGDYEAKNGKTLTASALQTVTFDLRHQATRASFTVHPTPDICRAFKKTGNLTVQYVWKPTAEKCCKGSEEHLHPMAVNSPSVRIVF